MLCPVLVVVVLCLSSASGAYVFPQIYLQARSKGGIKAFLPDSCGVEGFGFQIKGQNESAWKTGNGTKENRFWTFVDRLATARPGDEYDYAARVWYRGSPYSFPISQWFVTELVNDYTLPPLLDSQENCNSEEENSKENISNPKPSIDDSKENLYFTRRPPNPTIAQPQTTTLKPELIKTTLQPKKPKSLQNVEKKEDNNESKDLDNRRLEPTREPDNEQYKPSPAPPSPTFSIACNWLEPPGPEATKEDLLERQLTLLQCEMASFLERTTKLTGELTQELIDLKKLNYATVERMQRLEALIRTIPRAVPFSSFLS